MAITSYFKNKLRNLLLGKSSRLFPKNKSITISPDLIMGNYVNINVQSIDVLIKIDSNVIFKEFCSVLVVKGGKLSVDSNVFFNNYSSINCLEEIRIGANTLYGEGVKIYDHNHKYDQTPELKVYGDQFNTSPVIIGENCWIGSNVTILKGVTIGNNVIIGANNLIYKSIPSNSLVKSKSEINIQTF